MDKTEAIIKVREFKRLIENHFDISQIFLFGSYALGTSREHSDIDVAVLVDSIKGDYFETVPLLWKLGREVDTRIEPVLFEKGNDPSGFLEEVKRTGIEIK
jgi:predicted nucleotidyltransferase